MLGGISGGGMGFIFDPARKAEAQDFLQREMVATKRQLQDALPFAMDPVVYDFAINDRGTLAELCVGGDAIMPAAYYAICTPEWLRQETRQLSPAVRNEITRFAAACRTHPRLAGSTEMLLGALFPRPSEDADGQGSLKSILEANGFDPELHEQIRSDLRTGRIGLAQNRLPPSTVIEDVAGDDVFDASADELEAADRRTRRGRLGRRRGGRAGPGRRSGQPLDPRGRRGQGPASLLPLPRQVSQLHRDPPGQGPQDRDALRRRRADRSIDELPHARADRALPAIAAGRAYPGPLVASPGRSVGLRMIPMPRDLRFAWEEMPQQILDVQAQKVRESLHASLIGWAEAAGGGNDYTDNVPLQCLHPTGHWFEVPNMLRNGMLARLLRDRPQLKYLLLHNIDTLGANLDPGLLGRHIRSEACLSFEVIPRRIDDRGGGLARVNGRVRLVEGLAMPREEDEFRLSYYNSQTTWISIERLLDVFGLSRHDLDDEAKVTTAVRRLSMRLPTYITLKDVKKRWGHAQEDIFPVAQFEKLWSDMTGLAEVACQFMVVSRQRGQQLKDPAQLDGWLRDGSAEYVDSICEW